MGLSGGIAELRRAWAPPWHRSFLEFCEYFGRKIKDHEGQEGWVHHALLSGERTALVQGEDIVPIYKSVKNSEPLSEKDMVAYLKPFVLLSVEECENQWCYVKTLEKNTQFSGWIERKMIWGVYEDENFD